MALRIVREKGDEILTKKCKEVKEMNDKTRELIDDMLETMYDEDGVGLAAPQVGILKRLCVIDISEEGDSPIVLINPEIIETSGEQRGTEGCLSIPNMVAIVTRPNYVKVKALNIDMEPIEVEGEELMARALIHEIEHLDGHMYDEKAENGKVYTIEEFQKLMEENE